MISIAFNGQELGQFSSDEVAAMLESGQIDQTAHYWLEGMTEWRQITEIIQAQNATDTSGLANTQPAERPVLKKRDSDAPDQRHVNFLARRGFPTNGMTKKEVATLFERIKSEESRKANEITDRQKAFLDYHSIRYTRKTTKAEAYALIESADFPDSQWNAYKHLLYPDLYDRPTILATKADEVAAAQHAVKTAQDRLKLLKADSQSSEDDIYAAEDEVEMAKDDLASAKEFSDADSDDETLLDCWPDDCWPFYGEDLIAPYAEILKKPSKSQLKQIRQTLASDFALHLESLSLWQFCCIYTKLFPSVIKKGKRNPFGEMPIPSNYASQGEGQSAASQKKKGGVGCLKLMLWLIVALLILAFAGPALMMLAQ